MQEDREREKQFGNVAERHVQQTPYRSTEAPGELLGGAPDPLCQRHDGQDGGGEAGQRWPEAELVEAEGQWYEQ